MDFIYSRLNNNLVDINRLDTITLLACKEADNPVEGLKIGDYYLKFTVVDSDKVNYCSLADLNADTKAILEELHEEYERAKDREDFIEKTSANNLNITQDKKTGVVTIELLNTNKDILDTKTLDLETEKIICSVILDYADKKLIFNFVDGTSIDTDLSDAIDDFMNKISEVKGSLQIETSERETTDERIIADLTAETTTRTAKDTELETSIKDLISKISNEEIARQDADSQIITTIDAWKKEINSTCIALNDSIESEAASRTAEDSNLKQQITANSSDIESLSSSKADITYVDDKVSAESLLREAGDTAALSDAKTYTDGKVNEEQARAKAVEIALNDTDNSLNAKIDSSLQEGKEYINNAVKNEYNRALGQETSLDSRLLKVEETLSAGESQTLASLVFDEL